MPPLRFAAVLLLMLGVSSGCDERHAAPPPDRDQLYRLFQRAAEFSAALDRLDIVCGSAAPGNRVEWLKHQGNAILDAGQKERLAAFIEDRKEAVFETYRKEYCGFEISTERDNYVEAYKVHRDRLESAIAKFKTANNRE